MARYIAALAVVDCLLIAVGVLTRTPGPIYFGAFGVVAGCMSLLLRSYGRGRR